MAMKDEDERGNPHEHDCRIVRGNGTNGIFCPSDQQPLLIDIEPPETIGRDPRVIIHLKQTNSRDFIDHAACHHRDICLDGAKLE